MNKIWIVDIEAVDTRYTGQWKTWIPKVIKNYADDNGFAFTVEVIEGTDNIPDATTPGAFLNFGGTNVYKSSQMMKIARMFSNGSVTAGDVFLFTDAWNPTIIQLKYMSQLLNIPIKIHGLWHAGNYDKNDFLGRLIKDEWVKNFELSLAQAIDYNWFATNYHLDIFRRTYSNSNIHCALTGWPMEYLKDTIQYSKGKEDLILFPHRIAPEKQVQIFRDLAEELPEYKFIVCQDEKLTKEEYHELLGKAKIVFSANLQETLGISCYEGALAGALPMVPDRLSYSEMYMSSFKYPSEWTESYENYMVYKTDVVKMIRNWMSSYDDRAKDLHKLANKLETEFFSSSKLLKVLFNG